MKHRAGVVSAVLAALLATAATDAARLGAQEPTEPSTPAAPDTVTDPAPAAPAAPVAAAPDVRRLTITVLAGTVGGGDIQTQRVVGEVLDADGAVVSSSVMRRTLSVDRGMQLGASARLALGHNWAVRLGASTGQARLSQGFQGQNTTFTRDAAALPVAANADLRIVSLLSALQFRIPSTRPLQPYAEVGFSVETWESRAAADTPYPGAADLTTPVKRMAGHAGFGADLPLAGGLSAHLHGSTRMMRTPAPPATPGTPVAAGDTLTVSLLAPQVGVFADPAIELFRNLRLEIGLSYGAGIIARPRPDRSVSTETTSAPPR